MGTIFVIGGGEISTLETLPLDRKAINLTKKKFPKVLFIPTASGDAKGYYETFKKIYGDKLGCKVDCLWLLKKTYSKKELKEKILNADLIYVGGGNTLRMVNRWKHLGVDKLLKQAYKKGIVLTGVSAGGICWFDYGHSDSISFYKPNNWNYIRVSGIGLIQGIHCPHFDSATKRKSRKKYFIDFMQKYSQIGIGLDEQCAMEFTDNKFKVISCNSKKKAYRVFKKKSKVIIEEIPITKNYLPLTKLYQK